MGGAHRSRIDVVPHAKRVGGAALLVCLGALSSAQAADFSANDPAVHQFIDTAAREQGIDPDQVRRAVEAAHFQPSIIDAMNKPAEKHLRWDEYRSLFLQKERVEKGADFVMQNLPAMQRAEREYGVPRDIIAAIIGVETGYGANMGKYRVIDALSTLAFRYPARAPYFSKELAAYLKLTAEQSLDPLAYKGSYAGAMGYPQFMPSSYRAYAVDFTGDGVRDVWASPADAIGSVAHYFQAHGWMPGQAVVIAAKGPGQIPQGIDFNRPERPYVTIAALNQKGICAAAALPVETQVVPLAFELSKGGIEYDVGLHNFYVITRYNHSPLYAMAVTSLAKQIQTTLAQRQSQPDAQRREPQRPAIAQ